ncbi:hypothetical protein DNTS_028132 [Danionella cerebrum]|uniref:Thymocyte nuclear protein 1 n=1 Tax=Danionella cerebrum TaxID=2873325 RepID=A0A553QWK0_9TELE|nr:hypothetical protein DNTS_028132 [Danionella translucida]
MPPKKRTRSSAKANRNAGAVGPDDAVQNKTGKRKRSAAENSDLEKKKDDEGSKPSYSHWLMKSEPESRIENGVDVKFGIEDLKALPNQRGCWDGVRNYQARNFMRDMKLDQQSFFYHSNCKEPGIAGLMKVDVQFERMLKRFIPLSELKKHHMLHKAEGGPLKNMFLFSRARLSVQPLTAGKRSSKQIHNFI